MEVFGFAAFREHRQAAGASRLQYTPRIPLWAAGWCRSHLEMINDFHWDTRRDLWVLDARREALWAKMEDLCQQNALVLMSAGRGLGSGHNDVRLARAMQLLGLKREQLAVPANALESEAHRTRWLETLDYLIGPAHLKDTKQLHRRLCMLENTASEERVRRWMQNKTWQYGLGRYDVLRFVGDQYDCWQVDLCSEDGKRRVLAMAGETCLLILIQAKQVVGLQNPRHNQFSVSQPSSLDAMIVQIDQFLSVGDGCKVQPSYPRLAKEYTGGPVSSQALGLQAPQLRLRLGECQTGQIKLEDVLLDQGYDPRLGLHGQMLDLPENYFARMIGKRVEGGGNSDWANKVRWTKSRVMAGGLLRQDFPPVASRTHVLPQSMLLYRSLSPYQAIRPAGKRVENKVQDEKL